MTLAGAMPASIAASYAELCCDDCDQSGECEDDHEKDCDCPLGCNSCCIGSTARALVGHSVPPLAAPMLASSELALTPSLRPPDGVARDILKVPKRAG